ncbi:MAG TPA: DUF4405 domain-containing protein [Candidatus Ozemobacteraceae bacterium]
MLNGIVIVDLAGFVLLLLVALTGGIIKWHLPPGSGHGGHGLGRGFGHGYGHGHDTGLDDGIGPKLLWGMDRHEWGDIHFWLSVAFFAMIAIHLYQHRFWLRACLSRGGTCPTGQSV